MIGIFLILYLAQASLECPYMMCKSLDDGVCAQIFDVSIWINDKGCGEKICSAEKLYEVHRGYTFVKTDDYTIVKCYEDEETEPENIPNDKVDCFERNTDENLLEGSHPKICSTDDDCMIRSKTTTECKCGIDGKKYCQPMYGSNAFEEFWKRCEEDPKMYQKEWKLWNFAKEQYIPIVSAPTCGDDVLLELRISLDYIIDTANFIVLPYLVLTGVLFNII